MRIVSLIYLSVVLISCKERKGYVDKVENDGDNVYSVTSDDDDMNNAIAKARSTYDSFLKAFAKSDSNVNSYTVKLRFSNGENDVEHMWLSDLHARGDNFYGVLDSDPVSIKRVKWGDTIEIKKDSVSDWMYLKDNKMIGGFTIMVLYDKMSKSEKDAFKKEISFDLK